MKIKRFITRGLLLLAVCAALLVPAAPAFAEDVFGEACKLDTKKESAACQTTQGDPITAQDGIVHKVTDIVALIAGACAVIVIAMGGVRYIASNGDGEQVAKAKRTITYAAVGLVVIVLARTLINFVLMRI